jgi:NTP pyrophosphatase (non-canonical NTP hydrolase)
MTVLTSGEKLPNVAVAMEQEKKGIIQIYKYMNTQELITKCHQLAKDKGFWDKERNMQEAFALILSELYEAFQAHRKGRFAELKDGYFNAVNSRNAALVRIGKDKIDFFAHDFETHIKDTFEDELADVLIRIFDFCGGFEIDLTEYLKDYPIEKCLFLITLKATNNIGEKILNISYFASDSYFSLNKSLACLNIYRSVVFLCQELNIDIETHIELKLAYNATREKLHGKKY